MAKCLLSKGANVDPLDQDGESPLFRAASQGHDRMVTLLLEHNADVISCFPALVCSFFSNIMCVEFSTLPMRIEQTIVYG